MYKLDSAEHTKHKNKNLSIITWPKFEYGWSGCLEISSTTSNSVTLKKQKIGLSNVGKMYRVTELLRNAHTSLHRINSTNYFDEDLSTHK